MQIKIQDCDLCCLCLACHSPSASMHHDVVSCAHHRSFQIPFIVNRDTKEARHPREVSLGASHFLWLCGCGATSPSFEEVGPADVFEAASYGEQGVGARFRPAASRRFESVAEDVLAGAFHDAGSDRQSMRIAFGPRWPRRCECKPRQLRTGGGAKLSRRSRITKENGMHPVSLRDHAALQNREPFELLEFLDMWRLLQLAEDDSRIPAPVLHRCLVKDDLNRESLYTLYKGTLAPLDLLARVVSGGSAGLRRFHRLGFYRRHDGVRGPSRQFASMVTKHFHHSSKDSVTTPRVEKLLCRKRQEKMRKRPQPTSGVEHVPDPVACLPKVGLAGHSFYQKGKGTVRPTTTSHPANLFSVKPPKMPNPYGASMTHTRRERNKPAILFCRPEIY